MKTGGYDIVIEMNEKLANKFITAYYYMNNFPNMKGSYLLPIKNVPPQLIDFITIKYNIKFGIPVLDFIQNKIKIVLSPEANFIVLVGIDFKIEVFFSIEASGIYDKNTTHLLIDLRNPEIVAEINDVRFPKRILDILNNILSIALKEYLIKEITLIDLSPFARQSLPIPDVDKKLPLAIGDFKITDAIVATSINCLDYSGGDISKVEDFVEEADLAIGISENAMHRVFDFWWDNNTTIEKKTDKSGEIFDFSLKDADLTLDVVLTALVSRQFSKVG